MSMPSSWNGKVKEWRVGAGDPVAVDQIVCVVELQDGGDADIRSPVDGTVDNLLFSAGDTVKGDALLMEVSFSAPPKPPPAGGESMDVFVPTLAESITDGTLATWEAAIGDFIAEDGVVAMLETDKVSVEVRTPTAGVLLEYCADIGAVVAVGDLLFRIQPGTASPTTDAPPPPPPTTPAPEKAPAAPPTPTAVPTPLHVEASRGETREKMTRMRKRIGERLKQSQNEYAMLTTYQECDMSAVMDMRKKHKDAFEAKHGNRLGLMSPFLRASVLSLQEQPRINAAIDGDDVIFRDYVDLGVAVSSPRGLVVPLIRNAEDLSFSGLEGEVARLAELARTDKLSMEDLTGGTFSVSNGGVFGNLLSMPIINPPNSAILGLHSIRKRPVVIEENGEDVIVVRPMMYLALTYDHRLIDGKEAVTFLSSVRDKVEDPSRMLLDL